MYQTESVSGHTKRWQPDDEEAAEQAMIDVVDRFDEWQGTRYELDPETAKQVRERYEELIDNA